MAQAVKSKQNKKKLVSGSERIRVLIDMVHLIKYSINWKK